MGVARCAKRFGKPVIAIGGALGKGSELLYAEGIDAMFAALPAIMTLEEALDRVSAMLGHALDWTQLEAFLPPDAEPALRRSALASSVASHAP